MSDQDTMRSLKTGKRRILQKLASRNLSPEEREELQAQLDDIQQQIEELQPPPTTLPINWPDLRGQRFSRSR